MGGVRGMGTIFEAMFLRGDDFLGGSCGLGCIFWGGCCKREGLSGWCLGERDLSRVKLVEVKDITDGGYGQMTIFEVDDIEEKGWFNWWLKVTEGYLGEARRGKSRAA